MIRRSLLKIEQHKKALKFLDYI